MIVRQSALTSASRLLFASSVLAATALSAHATSSDETSNGRGAARQPFVESNGYLVMESESIDLVSSWHVVTTPPSGDPTMAGALGAGYLEWRGAQYFGNTIAEGSAVAVMEYNFIIQTAGDYIFRWRGKQYSNVPTNDAGNDSFIRFATGSSVSGFYDFSAFTKVWVQSKHAWSWNTNFEPVHGLHYHDNAVRRHYEPGLHQIKIAARSPRHAMDRIVLHHVHTLQPIPLRVDAGVADRRLTSHHADAHRHQDRQRKRVEQPRRNLVRRRLQSAVRRRHGRHAHRIACHREPVRQLERGLFGDLDFNPSHDVRQPHLHCELRGRSTDLPRIDRRSFWQRHRAGNERPRRYRLRHDLRRQLPAGHRGDAHRGSRQWQRSRWMVWQLPQLGHINDHLHHVGPTHLHRHF